MICFENRLHFTPVEQVRGDGGIDSVKSKEPSNIEINFNKRNPNINPPKNNSFSKGLLYQRGIKMLKDIGENEKTSRVENLKSVERKFPTILKVIVGIFTIGIGAAIMHKIEKNIAMKI